MPLWTWFGLKKGRATTGWPESAGSDGQEGVLGLPKLNADQCGEGAQGCTKCVTSCPSGAITLNVSENVTEDQEQHIDLDYARCVGCQLCTETCPSGAFSPSNDWAFAVRDRADLSRLARPASPDKQLEEKWQKSLAGFGRSLHIRHVDAGSCNGCESEISALLNPFYNLHRLGIFFTPSPRFADLLLVTGPVTEVMREPLLRTFEAMPEPRWVMALGTCATGGGTNGGGYACHQGLDGILPVDIWLPGCPPNPAAIIEALLLLLDRRPQQVHGGRHDA